MQLIDKKARISIYSFIKTSFNFFCPIKKILFTSTSSAPGSKYLPFMIQAKTILVKLISQNIHQRSQII